MTRLKVMFAIPALDRGGPDRVFFELLCSLDRSRFEPMLVVSEPTGHYLERLPPDVAVDVLAPLSRYPFRAALRAARRDKPDVILATLRMTFTMGLVAPLLPKRTRLVLRQANDFTTDFATLVGKSFVKHRLARWISMANLRMADAVVCQSAAMEADLRELLGARARLHVIGNPIDLGAVTRDAAASAKGQGSPALVSVGRLTPQKGYDILLPAIRSVRERHPQLHLTVFGDGPDRAGLEQQTRELGLGESVTFAGFTSSPLPHVRAATLFVLASRYEGFPNAALESLACGTPVMLTDCPGANAELVADGINGRLAKRVDAVAVATAIEQALADTYDRATIIARCRQHYAAERIVSKYEHLFEAVSREADAPL